MSSFIEKHIPFITGANRGIGRSLVEAFIARGAEKVYASARNTETLKELVSAYPEHVIPIELDVTREEQVNAAATKATDTTIVINNAGYFNSASILGGELANARQEFEVNYWGALYVSRAFAPVLKENGGGILATISSIAGLTNFPSALTYSDSKAAAHSLISGSRLTLAAQGTKVVGIYPGPVDTDMAKELPMEKATPGSVAEKILDAIESGEEEVFPDVMAENYRQPYEAGHKTLENATKAMFAEGN